MPWLSLRHWFLIVVSGAATTVLLGFALRSQWPSAIADPVAQAVGFTVSFLVAWPWFRQNAAWPWFKQDRDERLKFAVFAVFIGTIATLMALVRISYFPG